MVKMADWRFVKCIDKECGHVFRTKRKDNEECQCPHNSGGCGLRFPVKGNVVTI